MANTYKYVLLSLMRNKGILVWALLFPIILSCCFMMMFQGLDDVASHSKIRAIVVEDEAYESSEPFVSFMDAITKGEDSILDTTSVRTQEEARTLLQDQATSEDSFVGYVACTNEGLPEVTLLPVAREERTNRIDAQQSVLVTVMDQYCSRRDLVEQIAQRDSWALADPQVLASLSEQVEGTEKVSLTENAPKESVRYYFALLGMAAMFGAQASLIAVVSLLPCTSSLGARRALGAVSRTKALAACTLASWTLSFVCLTIAFLFMHFVAGVDVGSRNVMCLVVLAAASFMATALGTLIGSISKLPMTAKAGILTGFVCFAALFAGLYGEPTMALADMIASSFPASQYINPAVQVSEAFYSLMYYDSLVPFITHIVILIIMGVLFFAVAARALRRQRYASL